MELKCVKKVMPKRGPDKNKYNEYSFFLYWYKNFILRIIRKK